LLDNFGQRLIGGTTPTSVTLVGHEGNAFAIAGEARRTGIDFSSWRGPAAAPMARDALAHAGSFDSTGCAIRSNRGRAGVAAYPVDRRCY
jgi:hypothetical protein